MDKNTSDLVAILRDLVSFPTLSTDKDELAKCFDHVENYIRKFDVHVYRCECNGWPSLVATTRKTKSPKVLLQAHLDIVPGSREQFTLQEKSGRLYGRGVFDMKFAAASYLQLLQDLKDDLNKYDFGIMFTSDEEIGGENGVKYLLESGYSSDVCILPDGGNNWQIETSCNAIWMIRVSAKGQSSHSSSPWEGDNAINNLVDALSEIRSLFGTPAPFKSTLTISWIEGGVAHNQVPDHSMAVLDMRFVDSNELKSFKNDIELIADTKNLSIETLHLVNGTDIDINNLEISKFLKIAKKYHNEPIKKMHSFGSSDACYFSELNIPTIIIRPPGGGAHSTDEWIDKAEFIKFYEVLKSYIKESASKNR